MLIELCAQSIESVAIAAQTNVDRIELCAALETGGITPSYGLIKMARTIFQKPIFVLIRPRVGDFCYSNLELSVMEQDIMYCKKIGIDGIVIGVLDEQQRINANVMQYLLAKAEPMQVVFHRAFDRMTEFEEALETLIRLKIKRILTSGQAPDVEKGIPTLQKMMTLAQGRIEIMAGGGVTRHNIGEVISRVRPDAIHFSAKKNVGLDRTESDGQEIEILRQEIAKYMQ